MTSKKRSAQNGKVTKMVKEWPSKKFGWTITVDLRKSKKPLSAQADEVHRYANKAFFGKEDGLIKDGASGTFLASNMIEKYHVASIAVGMWVAATRELSPTETRALVTKHINGEEGYFSKSK